VGMRPGLALTDAVFNAAGLCDAVLDAQPPAAPAQDWATRSAWCKDLIGKLLTMNPKKRCVCLTGTALGI
jgi:hypothetical protein